jgi:hypothetical protein
VPLNAAVSIPIYGLAPLRRVLDAAQALADRRLLTLSWAKELAKKTLRARQVSPRGGDLLCQDEGTRIALSGPCALYLTGEIEA